jgi:hypothetical protein
VKYRHENTKPEFFVTSWLPFYVDEGSRSCVLLLTLRADRNVETSGPPRERLRDGRIAGLERFAVLPLGVAG